MKKVIIGIVVGVVLVVVAIATLKPELTQDLLPGLWSGRHKNALRARTTTLIGCLCRDDMDGCVGLTDPAFVRQNGNDKTKIRFKILSVVFTLAKIQPGDVRIDDVTLGPDSKTADVTTSIRIKDEWKVQKPTKWVRSDGQWYVTF